MSVKHVARAYRGSDMHSGCDMHLFCFSDVVYYTGTGKCIKSIFMKSWLTHGCFPLLLWRKFLRIWLFFLYLSRARTGLLHACSLELLVHNLVASYTCTSRYLSTAVPGYLWIQVLNLVRRYYSYYSCLYTPCCINFNIPGS